MDSLLVVSSESMGYMDALSFKDYIPIYSLVIAINTVYIYWEDSDSIEHKYHDKLLFRLVYKIVNFFEKTSNYMFVNRLLKLSNRLIKIKMSKSNNKTGDDSRIIDKVLQNTKNLEDKHLNIDARFKRMMSRIPRPRYFAYSSITVSFVALCFLFLCPILKHSECQKELSFLFWVVIFFNSYVCLFDLFSGEKTYLLRPRFRLLFIFFAIMLASQSYFIESSFLPIFETKYIIPLMTLLTFSNLIIYFLVTSIYSFIVSLFMVMIISIPSAFVLWRIDEYLKLINDALPDIDLNSNDFIFKK